MLIKINQLSCNCLDIDARGNKLPAFKITNIIICASWRTKSNKHSDLSELSEEFVKINIRKILMFSMLKAVYTKISYKMLWNSPFHCPFSPDNITSLHFCAPRYEICQFCPFYFRRSNVITEIRDTRYSRSRFNALCIKQMCSF